MFNRILVPLDGSERAERAIAVAARLARTGGTVVLARVVTPAPEYSPYLVGVSGSDEIVEAAREAEAYLRAIAKRADLAGVRYVQEDVRAGAAADELLVVAAEYKVDLIVLCSHGRTGLTRWVLGSVAQHIARHASVPVLVLREHGALPRVLRETAMVGPVGPRVLVPLDGSALAEATISPALALVEALSAPQSTGTLHLARVVEPADAFMSDSPRRQESNRALEYLDRVSGELLYEASRRTDVAPIRVTTSVETDLDIAAAVIRLADHGEIADGKAAGPFDMVVMATHGRSGVARWALGSITERVLVASSLPLLVVRPERSGAEPEPSKGKQRTLSSIEQPWAGLF